MTVKKDGVMVGCTVCLQLGEKQKELDRLQEQNLHLKEQLDEARGREHSAREGYVLQVPNTNTATTITTTTTSRGHIMVPSISKQTVAEDVWVGPRV